VNYLLDLSLPSRKGYRQKPWHWLLSPFLKFYFTTPGSQLFKDTETSQAGWYKPVIPALGILRQKYHEFEASLGYTEFKARWSMRPCLKKFKNRAGSMAQVVERLPSKVLNSNPTTTSKSIKIGKHS
jgi:hypothetical protein